MQTIRRMTIQKRGVYQRRMKAKVSMQNSSSSVCAPWNSITKACTPRTLFTLARHSVQPK